MELTKIEGTTLVSQYPSIQSENMTKLENHANSVDNTLDEHSTDIAYNRRHIDYLWKANEGISYNFEDDTNVENPKTVPSGSLACTINKVGGLCAKSKNLLPIYSEFLQTTNGVTCTLKTDGDGIPYYEFKGTSESTYTPFGISLNASSTVNGLNLPAGTYILSGGNAKVRLVALTNNDLVAKVDNGNGVAFTQSDAEDYYYVRADVLIEGEINESIYPMIRKSTDDSTYQKHWDGIVEYSADNVQVDGVNMIKGYSTTQGSYSNITVTSNGTSVNFSGTTSGSDNFIVINLSENIEIKSGKTYYFAFNQLWGKNANIYLYNPSADNFPLYSPSNLMTAQKGTFITPTYDFSASAIMIRTYTASETINISNFKICISEVSTDYVEPTHETYTIPSECKALEGYGWSAGTAYNYVDFENKQFVQNVGRVDLGTLTWTYSSSFNRFESNSAISDAATNYVGNENLLCNKYTMNSAPISLQDVDKTIYIYAGNNHVFIKDYTYTDENTLKSALSGVYLYYELATPVVTDISDILDDFAVEGNGTLTFVDTDNTDKLLPIPNEETYVVKVSEVAG